MLLHNFKYSFKTLLKNRMLIFWTFAFPIILGTFFNLAFSNIENSEKLDIINIAIVENEEFTKNVILKEAFKTLSDEKNENRLFNTQYVSDIRANELLENGEITGYILLENDEPKVTIKSNGINETILKYVTEEIMQNMKIIQEGYIDVTKIFEQSNIEFKNISNENLSYTMIEFYTLIAMACLYGGILGMVAINQNLANMSSKGKRISVGPVNKLKIVFSSIFASYVVQLVGLAILFLYTVFVLKVDYGNNLPLIILLGMIGSLAGLSMGLVIGSCIKTNENAKTGILISVTMLGCFLSGMMGITMKYIIDTNVPIVNKINPASMITDGFYSLYYYDTLDRYFFNISSLLIFSAVMILLSFISLRRQKYDSI